MRRFLVGALVGGALMYAFLHSAGDWRNWASSRFDTVGSQYRGDEVQRKAKDALR
jgi:hypothetical protein